MNSTTIQQTLERTAVEQPITSDDTDVITLPRYNGSARTICKCHICGCNITEAAEVKSVRSSDKVFIKKTIESNGITYDKWTSHYVITPQYFCSECAPAKATPIIVLKQNTAKLTPAHKLDLALSLRGLKEELGARAVYLFPKGLIREADEWAFEFCTKLGIQCIATPIEALVKLTNVREIRLG